MPSTLKQLNVRLDAAGWLLLEELRRALSADLVRLGCPPAGQSDVIRAGLLALAREYQVRPAAFPAGNGPGKKSRKSSRSP